MPDNKNSRPDDLAVDSFPVPVLPEPLADFVIEASRAISCPPDYVVAPMLPVLGTAIGTGHRIQIKEGWCEWPILWTATVGDTGTAKSPAQEKAVEPLVRLQSKLHGEFEEALSAARIRRKATEQPQKKAAAKQATSDKAVESARADAPAPQHKQAFTTDATLEALNLCLARNPRGIALVRDELTAWVLSMNEYKKGSGADRPHWQSIWNGCQIVVNRKNNLMPIIIPRPFVSVVGGLPPDMLGDLCDEQGREDGFIHRILFAFPDPVPRVLTDEGIRLETMNRYCEVFDHLRRLRLNMIATDPTVTLELAPGVFETFRDWVNGHYAEMENGPANLRGPWAKLVSYCARLALIIHLTRKVCGDPVAADVDAESVTRAITLICYFKSHARKVYRRLYATAEEIQITAAVEWLKKRPGYQASLRDFVTNKVGRVRNTEQALSLFRRLEENKWGHIERRKPSGGGRETILFLLNCRPSADRLQTFVGGRK
jgi:hypothetical protein